MSRKKKRRFKNTLKNACLPYAASEEDVRHEAWLYGMELEVSRVKGTSRLFLHWMFNRLEDERRILNWWPSAGTYWIEGVKGKEKDPFRVVAIAADLLRKIEGRNEDETEIEAPEPIETVWGTF